mmetsp:Transcript_31091/g.93242  ORF Transcript_31091/g.93242 Transcript_31091/m.93242 type:complete len:147 (-) Transcript_31091:647-1087(-)
MQWLNICILQSLVLFIGGPTRARRTNDGNAFESRSFPDEVIRLRNELIITLRAVSATRTRIGRERFEERKYSEWAGSRPNGATQNEDIYKIVRRQIYLPQISCHGVYTIALANQALIFLFQQVSRESVRRCAWKLPVEAWMQDRQE